MNILYGESVDVEHRYVYEVNSGGDQQKTVEDVTILFVNGVFSKVTIDRPVDNRSRWRLYGAIATKIDELERRHKE